MRSDVTFPSDGTDCAAWLYRPDATARTPLVVMAHGLAATRELKLDAYAERFAAAGLGVLLFDYRHFGSSGGEPRQLIGIGKQQADYHAAVAYGRGLEWVDPEGVALFGSSFSGGHVLAVAAKDARIAAVVSQCPFTDGLATIPVTGAKSSLRLTLAGLRDQAAALAGRPPHYIPAAGPPGSLALMTTPDAEPGMQALLPAETNWENRVAARIALRVPAYRPGRAAAKIKCPVLFCLCDNDTLAPADTAARYAAAAPRSEVKRYPIGHFDIYVEPTWSEAVGAQTEFLVRNLLGGAPQEAVATKPSALTDAAA